MKVTFWGVRGTFPATGERFVRYGGDTMCIEVDCGGQSIILDAGTGLRMLGEKLRTCPGAINAHLMLSHAHIDHLLGFLQFAPLWRKDASLTVWSAANGEDNPAEAARALLAPPFTPAGAANFVGRLAWSELTLGQQFEPFRGVEVLPFAVTHPGGACGYRIDYAGRSVVYITDHEHGDLALDEQLVGIAANADLLIYDATFTEEEMQTRRGWGHSTWPAGMRLRDRSGAKLVAFAHHEPLRTDGELDRMAVSAASAGVNAFFARQGMCIDL